MKVLITGGTGTVGQAIIKQNDNEYISISRNEENITNLQRLYPHVKCYVGNIEDNGLLLRVFKEVKPDKYTTKAAPAKPLDILSAVITEIKNLMLVSAVANQAKSKLLREAIKAPINKVIIVPYFIAK